MPWIKPVFPSTICRPHRFVSAFFFLVALLISNHAFAVIGAAPNTTIQNLPANTWYEVPNSEMRQVEAKGADYPGIWGNHPDDPTPRKSNFPSGQGVFLWSGAVFDDYRNRLVLWGGGHNSYYGNELYAFDLTSLNWERVTNPSPPTYDDICVAVLSDGNPNSRHTYYNLAYIPTTDKFFSTPAGTTSCEASGLDFNTWSFDFDSKDWLNLAPATELNGNGKAVQPPGWAPTAAAYNPLDNKVYSVGPEGLFAYDVVANRWDKLNSSGLGGDRGVAVDEKRELLVVVGRGEVVVYDLANQNYTPQFWDTVGDEDYNFNNNFRPGVNYDPVADRIVVWDGGAVRALNMDTRRWDDLAVAPQVRHFTGTYGRFRYSRRENAYVLVNDATENVLIYKLADPATLQVVLDPVDIAVDQGQTATFSVFAIGDSELSYQWRKNGGVIDGATQASYTLTASDMADNNAEFDVEITNNGGSLISASAKLTIVQDIDAPTVVSVLPLGADTVQVVFSEPVETASAQNASRYSLAPSVTVNSAVLAANTRVVLLDVSGLSEGTDYTLTIDDGISDRAIVPNIMTEMTNVDFVYRANEGFEGGDAAGFEPQTPSRWTVVQDGGDYAYSLNTSNFDSPGNGLLGEYSLLPGIYGDVVFSVNARLGDEVASNNFADMALLFGYQDANNYYYLLLNNAMSATQLFKVESGRRSELATATTDWLNDNLYHAIDIVRSGDQIRVTFDGNMLLSATDATFAMGRLGVGSFNDSAFFDDVRVRAVPDGDATNSAPTAASASITTNENTPSGGVSAQVTDPDDGADHVISIVLQPSNGTAQVINNKLVYTPGTGFVGNDSFQFSATDSGGLSVTGIASVTVLAAGGGNNAPTAASASITTYEDTSSEGVSAQVTDPDDGADHVISIVLQPTNGTAQVINNKLVYTPDSGFVGDDNFQFSATDSGGLSVTGTASVTVLAEEPSDNGGSSTVGGGSGGGGSFGVLLLLALLFMKYSFVFLSVPAHRQKNLDAVLRVDQLS